MNPEQIQFIRENEMHIHLVLDSNQVPQASHDIAKVILKIYEDLTGEKAGCCSDCIKDAYRKVWETYQLNPQTNGKETESQ